MHHSVAERLVVASSGTQYSEAVSMEGANAVYYDLVVYNIGTLASVKSRIQESDDLDNWYEVADSADNTVFVAGYSAKRVTSITSAYVRLRFTGGSGSGNAILGAGINTASL
ncbi:MAG: hypothetical protein IPN34_21305 [Planctomycetes bacterium]|nr:hypothetical protein [Planctomycetota bacterium]